MPSRYGCWLQQCNQCVYKGIDLANPLRYIPVVLYTELKSMLSADLERRVAANPRYSQRAFARSLGVSHSLLSLVLSGKRKISQNLANKIAIGLAVDPRRQQVFSKDEDRAFKTLDLDSFSLIADWYHYGILSLLETPGARFEAKWIAKRLGITEMQAKLAMERLQRLQLVSKESGRWKQAGKPIRPAEDRSTQSTRQQYRQALHKAEDALENAPVGHRDFSLMTFAMNPDLVPYAARKITQFRRKLMAELEDMGNNTEVFHLAVQIYPVSKSKFKSKEDT